MLSLYYQPSSPSINYNHTEPVGRRCVRVSNSKRQYKVWRQQACYLILSPINKKFIPIFLEQHPEKSRIGAGLACAQLWTVSKGMVEGDIVLCPDGTGQYHVGEIAGGYTYSGSSPISQTTRPLA